MKTNSPSPVPPPGSGAAQQAESAKRRAFLWLSMGWTASLFAVAASGFATVRSLIPNVLFEPSRRYNAGKPEDYPDETSTFIEEVRVFILRKGNSYRAVSAICPHLGCVVNPVVGEYPYLCPCHGSHFNEKGEVMSGPSPSGLTWYLMRLTKDGRLLIDMDRSVSSDKYLDV